MMMLPWTSTLRVDLFPCGIGAIQAVELHVVLAVLTTGLVGVRFMVRFRVFDFWLQYSSK